MSLRICSTRRPTVLGALAALALAVVISTSPAMAGDPPVEKSKPKRHHTGHTRHEAKKRKKKSKEEKNKMPALSFKMKDIDGKEQDLRQYEGNVVLMVNVASKCGLTPHYEGIEALYEKYKDRGLVVLGFPANNFGAQEPGTDDEIKQFCTSKFEVKFPMFSKVSVKGDDICPLYKYLTDEKSKRKFTGEIEWNFAKIIVNRKGEVAGRFHPKTAPNDKLFLEAIEKQLNEPIPEDSALGRKLRKSTDEKEKQGDKGHADKDKHGHQDS